MSNGSEQDIGVARLRDARRSPAVLKARLATLRSWLPKTPIFALEGVSDKPILHAWKQRLRPELDYEPFPCGGKAQVISLRDSLSRDLGGLDEGVYYFVDRDFDSDDANNLGTTVFVTDRYSFESYLVDATVVDETLKNELHCHAIPEVRTRIVELFQKVYDEFLDATKEVNFILFCARRMKLDLVDGLPEKVSKIAQVSLDKASALPETTTKFATPPDGADLAKSRPEFDNLNRRERYRGKFAILFFMRWLELLSEARIQRPSPLMDGADNVTKVRFVDISSAVLASRSPTPPGLSEFLAGVAAIP